jgi:hypothetical protein
MLSDLEAPSLRTGLNTTWRSYKNKKTRVLRAIDCSRHNFLRQTPNPITLHLHLKSYLKTIEKLIDFHRSMSEFLDRCRVDLHQTAPLL